MSYFSPTKPDRQGKPATEAAPEPRLAPSASSSKVQETVSTLGSGMLITGNIVSTGAVQIFGRVVGDIHAARLAICDGAYVEGKVLAQEAVIDGTFKGTIHANTVKLQATARVEGEVYNKSLTIEQNAQFEGVARRLDKAVEAPSSSQTIRAEAQLAAHAPAPSHAPAAAYAAPASEHVSSQMADVVQLTNSQTYSANNNDRPGWR